MEQKWEDKSNIKKLSYKAMVFAENEKHRSALAFIL